jgi:hypothetical protein
MTALLKSAYVSGGELIAMTADAVYIYKYPLTDIQLSKLLAKLGSATEINLEHWNLEWKESSTGIDKDTE